MALNVVLVVPPLRKKSSFYPPFGALSMTQVALKDGHNVDLLDFDTSRCSYAETVEKIVQCQPDVIGISSVVCTLYKYVKEITPLIKAKLPNVLIVVGGGLAESAETLLDYSAVDICVQGEGEETFKELLKQIDGEKVSESLNNRKGWESINGIVFKKNGEFFRTPPRALISDLDILPFPDYSLIDAENYILDIRDLVNSGNGNLSKLDPRISDPKRSPRFIRLITSRGCTTKCTFCYRQMEGLRTHSFEYIGDMIESLVKDYGVGHISFGDECFGSGRQWVRDFIKMVRKRKFDLTYHITGMRVVMVDQDILKDLREIGVWHIQYGFETGSQKILRIMEKNATRKLNIEAAQMTKAAGINTIPFIIVGYPGETTETVYETIDFLKRADLLSMNFRPNLPMATPGTPLYEYAQMKGFITDEDRYLDAISDIEAHALTEKNYFINYTNSSTKTVLSWRTLMFEEVNKHYRKKNSLKTLIRILFRKTREKGLTTIIQLIVIHLQRKVYAARERISYQLSNQGDQKEVSLLTSLFRNVAKRLLLPYSQNAMEEKEKSQLAHDHLWIEVSRKDMDLAADKGVNFDETLMSPKGESLRKINDRVREQIEDLPSRIKIGT
jgi:radical SAM superfamily enzyme YgiQ (UPF0313 family)